MKRILGLIGVAVLLLGFCGCGLLRSWLSSLTSDHKSEAEIVKETETTIMKR